jgi:hypothetical protein
VDEDQLGKVGPHPDLATLLGSGSAEPILGMAVNPDRVEVLQQRTFLDLPHPNARKRGRIAISSGLAIVHQGDHDILGLFEVGRAEGESRWGMMGAVTRQVSRPLREPFAMVGSVIPRTGLNVGGIPGDAEVAALRIELADGTTVEDAVSDRGFLLLALFRSPAAWAHDAVVRLLDSTGKEVASQSTYVKPELPPGMPIPRPGQPPR